MGCMFVWVASAYLACLVVSSLTLARSRPSASFDTWDEKTGRIHDPHSINLTQVPQCPRNQTSVSLSLSFHYSPQSHKTPARPYNPDAHQHPRPLTAPRASSTPIIHLLECLFKITISDQAAGLPCSSCVWTYLPHQSPSAGDVHDKRGLWWAVLCNRLPDLHRTSCIFIHPPTHSLLDLKNSIIFLPFILLLYQTFRSSSNLPLHFQEHYIIQYLATARARPPEPLFRHQDLVHLLRSRATIQPHWQSLAFELEKADRLHCQSGIVPSLGSTPS